MAKESNKSFWIIGIILVIVAVFIFGNFGSLTGEAVAPKKIRAHSCDADSFCETESASVAGELVLEAGAELILRRGIPEDTWPFLCLMPDGKVRISSASCKYYMPYETNILTHVSPGEIVTLDMHNEMRVEYGQGWIDVKLDGYDPGGNKNTFHITHSRKNGEYHEYTLYLSEEDQGSIVEVFKVGELRSIISVPVNKNYLN